VESEYGRAGEGEQRSLIWVEKEEDPFFLQFVTLRCAASFLFLHSLLQPTPSFALASMILIDVERERERERERILKFQRQSKWLLLLELLKCPLITFKRE